MEETELKQKSNRSPIFGIFVALGGIFLALLMLMGFFSYLSSVGFPTGVVSFLLVLIGVFSLASAGSDNYLPSLFIILAGLFLFASSLNILGSATASWLWPVFIILFGLLLLIYKAQPKKG